MHAQHASVTDIGRLYIQSGESDLHCVAGLSCPISCVEKRASETVCDEDLMIHSGG